MEPQQVEVIHDSLTHCPLIGLIDDAYRIHNNQNHQSIDMDNALLPSK